MAKYLIEVPHDPETLGCARVVRVFLASGSHFLTHADWGCHDGDHRAIMIVDVADKFEARGIVPSAFRSQTKVTALNRFNTDYIDEILHWHAPPAGAERAERVEAP